MKRLIPALVLMIGFSLLSTRVLASGIELKEQDAHAQARALAVRAWLDNPATLFFNPAGLAWLDGFGMSAGVTLVFPSFEFSDPTGQSPKSGSSTKLVPPPHGYLAFGTKIHKGGRLGAGLGVNFPFGMTIEWPDDFAGRHLVKKSALQIPQIHAGVAYSPVKQISFGANFVLSPANVYLERYLGPEFGLVADDGSPITDARVQMAGSGMGYGFVAGLQARPVDWLYLGMTWHSGMSIDMDGDAHFVLPGLSDKSGFADQPVKTGFKLPDVMAFGIGARYKLWYVEVDIDYTFWSVFKDIPINLPEDQSGTLSQSIPEYWKDVVTFRLGNQLQVTPELTLSFGGGYDQTPTTSAHLAPMLPDSDRIFGSLGVGYRFDFGLSMDMAYLFTWFVPRTVTGHACTQADPECLNTEGELVPYGPDGSLNWVGNRFPANYDGVAQLLAVTVGWQF
jgi:long-chain fatty acid transport protein